MDNQPQPVGTAPPDSGATMPLNDDSAPGQSPSRATGATSSSETQRLQLLRHYADYFPTVLFASDSDLEQFCSTMDPLSWAKEHIGIDGEPVEDPQEMAADPRKHMYILQRVVGRNQSTAAFVALRASDRIEVVAKVVMLEGERQANYARSEGQCLAVTNHFGIVKHFDDFHRENRILLVMEYGSGGDLNRQIKQRVKERLPFKEHEVGLLFFQIVLALDDVHSHRMIHRDLKSANIFLMPTGVIKLGDFGFSKLYNDSVSLDIGTSFCGTPYYLAPELWERRRYSKKADMWSLGVILYELLTLHRPFKGPSQREIMQQVLYSTYDPFPCPVSAEMKWFLDQLLNRDPSQRPTTRQLLETEFLKYVATIFEEIVTTSEVINQKDKEEILSTLAQTRTVVQGSSGLPASSVSGSGTLDLSLVHGGYLLKLSSDRKWKKRYFLLRDGALRISITDNPDADGVVPQSVSLESINDVLPVPAAYSKNHPHQIVVWFCNGKKIIARAQTAEERDQWIGKLHAAFGI
jgi:serine/threonine protein kinase